ncbi:hypothetical protein GCM10011504_52970 [Siccirubricoccus deserti]|uniref:DUF1259 domain-containing protein n=1 Tax=Siccirubricoccus deserti TaxID=2013562 RepID=A0A9X0UK46_9PROT|nr:DUF1259 domain-containing protein [Siccirubricoccus deserti]MBC4018775.1 DUF1259 domain-containing protein [Siccirubricoccus deserti]GGC68382.1 hypothetical protein GCM10011504_52970 [Siccirubricoccus deserti]
MSSKLTLCAALVGLALAAPGGLAQAQQGAPDVGPADWKRIVASTLGKPGTEQDGGVYRVSLPRTDLKVTVGGVEVRPGLALGSWLAFHPYRQELMVMGDLVLLEREVAPVMRRLAAGGIEVTALHNHLLRAEPATMYLHVAGQGDPAQLSTALRVALQETATPLQGSAPGGDGDRVEGLDTAAIARVLGREGRVSGGVYQVSIPRAERIAERGREVPTAMGLPTVINFQAAGGGRAATTGDFVLTADEVVPVQRALVENGIEVTAIHNHMLGEEPRLFFMHFWAVGEPEVLGRGLRAALDRTNSRPAGG